MYLCVHTCSKGSYSPSRAIYLWEAFFAKRVFGSCFSLESSGWLRGCRAGSGSGRPYMHVSIVVPRGGAYSHGFLTWPVLSAVRWSHGSRPRRQPSSLALSPPHTAPHPTIPYPSLPWPDLPYPACLPLHHLHLPLCAPDLTYISLSLSLCSCRVALLHCTMQPVMAMKTSAPCSWRRALTSQLETR